MRSAIKSRGLRIGCVLIAALTWWEVIGCQRPSSSSFTAIEVTSETVVEPLPDVLGLAEVEVASLASLQQLDDYPLYLMHVYEAADHVQTLSSDGAPSRSHQVHYLLADADGNAALVEYYQGSMVVVPATKRWHLATNHFRAALEPGDESGCWRYDRLERILSRRRGRLSPFDAMALLSDVAQPSTQWSAVYDLSDLTVHVAIGAAYAEAYRFELP